MLSYLIRRLLWLLLTLTGVAVLVFVLIRLVPADVVDMLFQTDTGGSYVDQQNIRAFFGLDVPVHVQFARWFPRLWLGDLGTSFRTGAPVTREIVARLPVTLELIILGTTIAVTIGIPVGVAAAVARGSLFDTILRPVSMIGLSIPTFWLGTLLLLVFSATLPQISFLGYASILEDPLRNLKAVILPSLALGVVSGVGILRLTRSSVLEVLGQDYIRTARAKGLSERAVVYRHAVRNAMLPVVTFIGIQVGVLLGGTIVLEEVFALPGLGRLVVEAIRQRDYPVVQGIALTIALLFGLINLATDLLYTVINPRIKR